MKKTQLSTLPVRHDLTVSYIASLAITLIMIGVSIAGVIYQSVVYPAEMAKSYVANDWVNLFIGVPILLISMWLAWRGSLIGLLFWPGALFYVLYTYIAYVVGLPFNLLFLVHLILVVASAYTLVAVAVNFDSNAVRQRLSDSVPVRVSGGFMAAIAIMLILRVIVLGVTALSNGTPVVASETSVWVADLIECPALLIGGILLWRRESFGYVAGAGMLFQFAALSIGVIPIVLIQTFANALPVDGVGLAILAAFAAIPVVLLVFFVRGAKTPNK